MVYQRPEVSNQEGCIYIYTYILLLLGLRMKCIQPRSQTRSGLQLFTNTIRGCTLQSHGIWCHTFHTPETRKNNALGARIQKGANLSWPLMSNFPVELAPRGKDLDSHGILNFFNWRVVTPKPLGATPSQTEVCMVAVFFLLLPPSCLDFFIFRLATFNSSYLTC